MPYWCPDCRKYFSVRTGTILRRSHISLQDWAFGIYLEESSTWQTRTGWSSLVLFAVAVFFLFARNLGLDTDSTPDAIQLAVAKVFVFATVSYAVYLCARNFLAHKHNAIVNKHRQNALLTYTTLAEAAHSRADQDVVLTYAAACIFGPQPTGYTREGGEGFRPPNSVIGLVKDAAEGRE